MKTIRLLPLLIFVSMLSFSLRLVEVIDGAFAVQGPSAHAESAAPEAETPEAAANTAETPVHAESGAQAGSDFPEWRDPADDDPAYEATKMEVFEDLSQRRQELDKKERTLATKEALLQAAEQELDRKYQELDQLRKELEGLLETQSEEEKARIMSLVKIYEGMKPKDAARIFDTLDLDILVDVVGQMSERKLSPILAAMNAERARTLTIMLAEQKQLPTLP